MPPLPIRAPEDHRRVSILWSASKRIDPRTRSPSPSRRSAFAPRGVVARLLVPLVSFAARHVASSPPPRVGVVLIVGGWTRGCQPSGRPRCLVDVRRGRGKAPRGELRARAGPRRGFLRRREFQRGRQRPLRPHGASPRQPDGHPAQVLPPVRPHGQRMAPRLRRVRRRRARVRDGVGLHRRRGQGPHVPVREHAHPRRGRALVQGFPRARAPSIEVDPQLVVVVPLGRGRGASFRGDARRSGTPPRHRRERRGRAPLAAHRGVERRHALEFGGA